MMDLYKGIKQINYTVHDMAQAKALYSRLLGVKPYMDQPYYIGFRVGGQEIGLVPDGHEACVGPVGYYVVSDIQKSIQSLVAAGAQLQQAAHDVGGGKLVATLRDADGNLIGLIQEPK